MKHHVRKKVHSPKSALVHQSAATITKGTNHFVQFRVHAFAIMVQFHPEDLVDVLALIVSWRSTLSVMKYPPTYLSKFQSNTAQHFESNTCHRLFVQLPDI